METSHVASSSRPSWPAQVRTPMADQELNRVPKDIAMAWDGRIGDHTTQESTGVDQGVVVSVGRDLIMFLPPQACWNDSTKIIRVH